MSEQYNEFAAALRQNALKEFKALSQAWHEFIPQEGDTRSRETVDVRSYGGFGASLLPTRHVSLAELDELIGFMESLETPA